MEGFCFYEFDSSFEWILLLCVPHASFFILTMVEKYF